MFWNRVRMYLVGVVLGCLLVAFFFRGRLDWLTSWLPENRVLNEIKLGANADVFNDCARQCGMSVTAYDLIGEADVDFSKSKVHESPKIYHLQYTDWQWKVAVQDSTAELLSVSRMGEERWCLCE